MPTLEPLLDGRTVCVCAGPGGVGKTTTAAAIALAAAQRGARVAVVTIDPARRLLEALGVDANDGRERRVDPERLAAFGVGDGELWASALNPRAQWDALIERFAPDAGTREAILANRIYQELAGAVAGSTEYIAMERVHELRAGGGYDLLVLDTPPSRNVLDFLDAPDRLSRFLDSSTLRLLLSPGRTGLRLFGRGGGLVLGLLSRIAGADLVKDLTEFFDAFAGMAVGVRDRARGVEAMLAGPETALFLVTAPTSEAVTEALILNGGLRSRAMVPRGAIVNRVHTLPEALRDDDLRHDDLAGLEEPLRSRVAAAVAERRALASRDAAAMRTLADELDGAPLLLVPELAGEVHDLNGLARVAAALRGGPPADAAEPAAEGAQPAEGPGAEGRAPLGGNGRGSGSSP